METWIKCYDCGAVFMADHAAHRKATDEDGLPPWETVAICPSCRSDDLTELANCEMCGLPVTSGTSDFCLECRDLIDKAFLSAFETVHGKRGGDYADVIDLMFRRAEETDFYS